MVSHPPFAPNSGSIKAIMDTLSTGAATAGSDTTTYQIMPTANGLQVFIYQIVRAGA